MVFMALCLLFLPHALNAQEELPCCTDLCAHPNI
jgi:hypothetical protein